MFFINARRVSYIPTKIGVYPKLFILVDEFGAVYVDLALITIITLSLEIIASNIPTARVILVGGLSYHTESDIKTDMIHTDNSFGRFCMCF